MRLQRKEVVVLVETAEKWKPHKKPKKEKRAKLEPSRRHKSPFLSLTRSLDDFREGFSCPFFYHWFWTRNVG